MNKILQILLIILILGLGCAPDRGLMPITTSSDEARKLFFEARDLYENYMEEYADTLFWQATNLDPDFALAHLWRWTDANVSEALELIHKVSKGESLMIRAYKAYLDNKDSLCGILADSLVELYPRDIHCLFFAGERWSFYDEKKAIKYFKEALRIDRFYTAPYIRTCVLLKRQNDYAEAKELYDRYIDLIPGSGIAHVVYGNYLLEMGDISEAIEIYKRAIDFEPNYMSAYQYLIWANILNENYTEAISYSDILFDSSISDVRSEEYPLNSSMELALSLKAMVKFVQFDYVGSFAVMDSLITLNQNFGNLPNRQWSLHLKSWYELEAGYLESALNSLSRAMCLTESEDLDTLERLSSSFMTHGIKSLLFSQKGDIIQAQKHLNSARSIFQTKSNSNLEVKLMASFEAESAIQNGNYDLAISQVLIPAKYGAHPSRYYLAKAYDLAGKREEAIKYYSLNCQILNPFFSGLFFNKSKERLKTLENE